MARPSKTQQFAIYQDAAHIPSTPPDSCYKPDSNAQTAYFDNEDIEHDDEPLNNIQESIETSNIQPTDTEYDRRESAISSMPESSTETDGDYSLPMYKSYTSPLIRPSFRKPDSVRSHYDHSSKKTVYHARSRTGTPGSMRASAKGSPLARRRHQEEEVEAKQEYPLVLLHITLLPVELRWSRQSMQELLPPYILENQQLLRSKVSETILQRGILILHPKDEYELLEERLLEALELKKERVTKCGHFRARESISSASSAEDSVKSSDSGVGSSVDSDHEICMTCCSPMKTAASEAGSGKHKWSIKVFAANGLMRASAWAAAWSEMESVDVEILPWIDEDLRKQLDARLTEEDLAIRLAVEEVQMREVVEQQVGTAYEEIQPVTNLTRDEDVEVDNLFVDQPSEGLSPGAYEPEMLNATEEAPEVPGLAHADLPPVYARKDIPLSLLLKNYVFLLAQDKRNIVIFGLAVLSLWMSLRSALAPSVDLSAISATYDTSEAPVLTVLEQTEKGVLRDPVVTVDLAEEADVTDAGLTGAVSDTLDSISADSSPVDVKIDELDEPLVKKDVSTLLDDSMPFNAQEKTESPDMTTSELDVSPELPTTPAKAIASPIEQHLSEGPNFCVNPSSQSVLFG